jgi:(1->4)-alpha-D-glucan 1-alpha-D-glucosylmutase
VPRYPVATYRVQLNKDFPFSKAVQLIPYLAKLGISDLYASPVFAARPGSTHGYDVVDPSRANPELGGNEGFDRLAGALQARGLGLVLDIVPNHMAATSDNAWWMDVLENGGASEYAAFFDVEWDPAWERGEEKIVLPVLGSAYGTALENGELKLSIRKSGFSINYYETSVPVDCGTYSLILQHRAGAAPHDGAFRGLIEQLGRLPDRHTRVWEGIEARRREIPTIKAQLWSLYQNGCAVRDFIDGNITAFNGRDGDPKRFDLLDRLIGRQAYRLAWWKVARERMNYRRFFDVSELIGVRVENPEVFARTHAKISEWVRDGKATGLRVDHVDGLYKPREYLEHLNAIEPRPYVVVEKILLENERLPGDWPIDGTSGYDFLGVVNGILIDGANLDRLQNIYRRFTGLNWTVEDAAYEQKRWIILHLFRGEMSALSLHLELIADMDRHGRDISPEELRRALAETTACLPVYRTYMVEDGVMSEADRRHIQRAASEARRRNPEISGASFAFLERVLICGLPDGLSEGDRGAWIRFVMRWQQLTGPITAKGVEDTTMYVYNRLLSMNEVGGYYTDVSLKRFHNFNAERRRRWPAAMNTISTHDTKRSADVRARLNVLSEIPDEWERMQFRWSRWNRDKKTLIDGRAVPDGNEETLIYQTLLGAWPLDPAEETGFVDRVKQFLTKASREAKVYSTWLAPNEAHEAALHRFAESILSANNGNRFLPKFRDFQQTIAYFGALNSLTQTLMMMTCPGIPDFYQNTALWDLTMVDPDNRRPVELDTRLRIADEISEWEGQEDIAPSLLRSWTDGRVKAYLIHRVLKFRCSHPEFFLEADYTPLEATGAFAKNVIAFERSRNGERCIAVAPRFCTRLVKAGKPPVGPKVWRDTAAPAVERGWSNVITGERVAAPDLGSVLKSFPVALLTNMRG